MLGQVNLYGKVEFVTTCGSMSESAESTWQLAPSSDRVCQHKQIEDLVLDAHVLGGGKRLPLRIIIILLAAPFPTGTT